MFDYGNARIAARRSRLLDGPSLDRLAAATTPGALIDQLARSPDWRPLLQAAEAATTDSAAALALAVELHRSTCLGDLPSLYPPPARGPVEALVLPLDEERVIAILRRQHGRVGPDEAIRAILPGARRDLGALRDLARQPGPAAVARRLIRSGVLGAADVAGLTGLSGSTTFAGRPGLGGLPRPGGPTAPGGPTEPTWTATEAAVREAFDGARARRAQGRGQPAAFVRALLDEEGAERRAVTEELAVGGPTAAALVERGLVLGRLERLVEAGPRDPLGIGAVAGYVAAVELQAIRIRLVLARVGAGWSAGTAAAFLPAGQSRRRGAGCQPTGGPPLGGSTWPG